MRAPIAALAFLASMTAWAKIDLTLPFADGTVLKGDAAMRVRVASDDPVTQVEFYVNDDLRETDSSTPYEFKLDTIAENDGSMKLTFAAYNTAGQSVKKSVTVRIDNEVAKGAAFHVERGTELVTEQKWDEAIVAGRIALKADEKSIPARLLLARAYRGKGELDQVQKYLEDVLQMEPGNAEAGNQLAAAKLRLAFQTFVRDGGSASAAVDQMGEALKAAVRQRKRVLDANVEAGKAGTKADAISLADAAIRAHRFTAAIEALRPFAAEKDMAVLNRLAFAQMRAARPRDAFAVYDQVRRENTLDAYAFALNAVLQAELGGAKQSDALIKEAILSDSQALSTKTAQAFIALKYIRVPGDQTGSENFALNGFIDSAAARAQAANSRNTMSRLLADLANERVQTAEADLFRCAVAEQVGEYARASSFFQDAALAEPLMPDLYILRANQLIRAVLEKRVASEQNDAVYRQAQMLFEVALEARDSSPEALTGLATLAWLQKDWNKAIGLARAAANAGPQYAAAHWTLSGLAGSPPFDGSRSRDAAAALQNESRTSLAKAGELDRAFIGGRDFPTAERAWRYFATGGRTPIISAPR